MHEFRLYYDENGNPITYTTEKLDGNYIVITKEQYSLADHHIKVKNGVIVKNREMRKVSKLEKNNSEGIKTSKYDINILLLDDDNIEYNYWSLVNYE